MIEKYMESTDLTPAEEALYSAALQVRGGVEVSQVLKWWPQVSRGDLETLVAEMAEYDAWRARC